MLLRFGCCRNFGGAVGLPRQKLGWECGEQWGVSGPLEPTHHGFDHLAPPMPDLPEFERPRKVAGVLGYFRCSGVLLTFWGLIEG